MKQILSIMTAALLLAGCRSNELTVTEDLLSKLDKQISKAYKPDLEFAPVSSEQEKRVWSIVSNNRVVGFEMRIAFSPQFYGDKFADAVAMHENNILKKLVNTADKTCCSVPVIEALRTKIRFDRRFNAEMPFEVLDSFAWMTQQEIINSEWYDDGKFTREKSYSTIIFHGGVKQNQYDQFILDYNSFIARLQKWCKSFALEAKVSVGLNFTSANEYFLPPEGSEALELIYKTMGELLDDEAEIKE